jgi:hypothetical protein
MNVLQENKENTIKKHFKVLSQIRTGTFSLEG